MAYWRGYANLILDRMKYAGDGIETLSREQIKLGKIDRTYQVDFNSFLLDHESDMPMGN